MLNERDEDKIEGQDDSEYHFTDDDVSYEIEPETEQETRTSTTSDAKLNIISQLTRSRILISMVVFIVLVYIVYKMVAPRHVTPPAEIKPVQSSTTVGNNLSSATQSTVATTPTNPPPPQVTHEVSVNPPAAPAQVAVTPPTSSSAPQVYSQETAMNPMPAANMNYPGATSVPSYSGTTESGHPGMVNMAPASGGAVNPTPMNPPMVNQQPTMGSPSYGPASAYPPSNGLPPGQTSPIVPMQMPVPTYVTEVPQATPSGYSNPPAAGTAALVSPEYVIKQLQAEYLQRMNEMAEQNKQLQSQMQSLNSRVMNVESQLNQLLRAVTPVPEREQRPVSATEGRDARINYSVQAIIPGRAWLRSDNGDSITVAEGDTIKGVGRIVKIDPYDGIVEINTGTKVVSLSYGTVNE